MKNHLLLLASSMVTLATWAQVPTIISFTPASGPIGTSVLITGTNFSSTGANNTVYFGATKATVIATSLTQLTVTVPVGATYQPITVTVGGLTAYSSKPFVTTFSGGGTIDASSFGAKVDFAAPQNPGALAIGDLDGDGKPDLAVTNTSGSLSVFKNTSSSGVIAVSSFAANVDFSTGTGTNPYSVAIGDLDGDGKLDLAIANSASNSVSVFKNTSTIGAITASSFAAKVDFTTGTYPFYVAIGDLDGDGKPDLAVANGTNATISIFKNTSITGTITASSFAAKVDFTAGTNPYSVAIGDLDGDGKPDLAVPNYFSNSVSVFKNTSTTGTITAGSFAAKVDFSTGTNPTNVAIGDLDGDGKPDLAVLNAISNNVSVFKNTSTTGSITASSFAAKVDFSTGISPIIIDIGDLDGDGKPDLAVANYVDGTVSVFKNTSTLGTITANSFAAKVDFTAGMHPRSVAIGDLDGDGKPDLAGANNGSASISIFRNTIVTAASTPTITSFSPTGGAVGTSVTIAGTNFSTATSNNIVYFGATKATVTAATTTRLTVTVPTGATYQPITATVGGLTAYSSKPFVTTFLGGGSIDANSFTAKVDFITGTSLTYPYDVAIGDLDGDGKPDLAVANNGVNSVLVFENTSASGAITASSFAAKVEFATGAAPLSVAIGDLDGDGKQDLVVANYNSGSVSVFKNTSTTSAITTSSFAAKVDFTTGLAPLSVAIGDLDGDGKPDLAVTNQGGSSVSVFKNTSTTGAITTSSFAAKVDFTTGASPLGVAIGDLDGDGKPDLAAANNGSASISIFRNTIVTAASTPTITSFTPTSGAVGTSVTITGTNFTGATALSFGGTAATSYNVVSATSITAVVGNGTTGRLSVTTPQGTATGSVEIGSSTIENNSTGWSGSWQKITTTNKGSLTSVVLKLGNGSNLNDYNLFLELHKTDNNPSSLDPSNKFNSLLEASVSVAVAKNTNPKEITFPFSGVNILSATTSYYLVLKETSGNPIGTGEQSVYKSSTGTDGAAGNNSGTLYYKFSMSPVFYVVPSILSFAPATGAVGTAITITGKGFSVISANNLVMFNGTTATVTASTATSITASVPTGATTGVITVTVNGQTATSATGFTVLPAPTITNFNPTSGGVGATVTITGTNFDIIPANDIVKFNGTAATITGTPTTTSIVTSVPTGAASGNITVTVNGQTATSSTTFTVITDTTPPVVANSTAASIAPNTAIPVSAILTDAESGIASAKVQYRPVAGSSPNNFVSLDMTLLSGSTWQASIPASAAIDLGVEFRYLVVNGAGLDNTASQTVYKTVINHSSGLTISSYPGSAAGKTATSYRIIAIPLVLQSKTANNVFNNVLGGYDPTIWRMFRYNGSNFGELNGNSVLVPGEGYFFICVSSSPLNTGPGTTVDVSTSSSFIITLNPGWNQIGNPYNFNISWADVVATNPSETANLGGNTSKIRTFRGTVENVDVLKTFEGGFVKYLGSTAGNIKIPVAKNTSIQGRVGSTQSISTNSLDQPSWEILFNLKAGDMQYNLGGLGMRPDAKEGFDYYDDFNAPRFIDYMEIKFPKKYVGMTYTKDVVPTNENFVWQFNVESNLKEEVTSLNWDNSYFGSGKEIYLLDVATQRITNMNIESGYEFNRTASKEFKVVYGSSDYVKKEIIPSRVILFDPSPNPFTDRVSIEYSLPKEAETLGGEIEIYNIIGSKVSSIALPKLSGTGRWTWESEGQSQGFYLVRLKVGDGVATKKLLKK